MKPFAELAAMIMSLYTSVVLLRFFMQYFRTDFYNPLAQVVVKLTDVFVRPLRRVIPGIGGIDLSTLVLAWVSVLLAELIINSLLGKLGSIHPLILLLSSLFGVIYAAINLFIFLIIIRAILSFVATGNGYNPAISVFIQITEPFLAKFRAIIPPVGGFDFSLIPALILLIFIKSLISHNLEPYVISLAF